MVIDSVAVMDLLAEAVMTTLLSIPALLHVTFTVELFRLTSGDAIVQ